MSMSSARRDRIDRLLINLSIISHIPENGKLRRETTGYVTLEDRELLTNIRRALSLDNRKRCLRDLRNIIDESIQECHEWRKCHPEDVDTIRIFYKKFKSCMVGLSNLKFTYSSDVSMASALELIQTQVDVEIAQLERQVPCLESEISPSLCTSPSNLPV